MLSPMSQTGELRLIRCQAGGESFCLPMDRVRSIQRSDLLDPSPGEDFPEEAAVAGSLSAFGIRIPVTSLARRLDPDGGGTGDAGAPSPGGTGAVVVLDHPEGPWGLLVDRVSRLPGLTPEALLPLPEIAGDPERTPFRGVVRLDEELALHLDLDRLRPGAALPASPPASVPGNPGRDGRGGDRAAEGGAGPVRGPRPVDPAPSAGSSSNGRLVLFSCASTGDRPLFELASFALSLSQVQEVTRRRPATRVPGAPPYLLGLISWRRKAVPVVDLPQRLGLGGSAGNAVRLLVARGAAVSRLVAFPVHAEVRMATLPLDCRPAAPGPPFDSPLIRGLFEHEERVLVLADLDRVLTSR